MAKTNTKRLTSHVWRMTLHSWILIGALAAVILNIGVHFMDAGRQIEAGVLVISAGAFLLLLVIGLIVAFIKSDSMRRKVAEYEKTAAVRFDDDHLETLTDEANLILGKEWLVIKDGSSYAPLPRTAIAEASSPMNRKEGMQKLWATVKDTSGKSYTCMYRRLRNDPLEQIQNWLGISRSVPEAAVQAPSAAETAPAVQTTSAAETAPAVQASPAVQAPAAGICPFCTGSNEPGAEVCQWCGSKLQAAGQTAPAFTEPAAAASVSQTASAPASIPDTK